ncbi:MAG TPA: exodeoxyribonuclease III [Bacteriovoracaceae bacterium]|nr:exodeoxyribonuclease III [Bacteriovoracaceae bacterium]
MKLISWNVNGIRAVANKGFVEWFTTESPDILCLQETKAQFEQFPSTVMNHETYEVIHSSAEKKGYSGVATFSREIILDTKKVEKHEYDSEGRVLIHELKDFYLLNCYFPNGQRDHKRVPFKLAFCDLILERMNELRKKKPVIVTGDFNTSHMEIDLANPKTNKNTTGFLPDERAWMDKFVSQGWVDIFRHLHPEKEGAYTWWSQMNPNIRERNIGWRLDYFFVSPELVPRVKRAEILCDVTGSDHCPVLLELI